MARTFWFVAGAGAGAYAFNRARRLAESLTADGLRDRVNGIGVGARMFRDEVRAGAVERETELRERYGLVPDGRRELPAAQRQGLAPEVSQPEGHELQASPLQTPEQGDT